MMNAVESSPPPLRGARPWPLSLAAYHGLGELGLIPQNAELLHGFIYTKMPKSPFHSFLVQFLLEALSRVLRAGYLLRSEQPVTCLDSELEPDLAVVTGRKEDYRRDHPRTAELVIEVCVTSADYDRSKLSAYAAVGVRECWLILGPEKRVEVYRQPADGEFNETTIHGPNGKLCSQALPEFSLDLDALFAQ